MDRLEVDATTLNATTSGAVGDDVFLEDLVGGVTIGQINAGSGNVSISSTGQLVGDAVPVVDVIANLLTADAVTTISLDTTVTTADLSTSGAANIDINETDAIVLSNVDTANGTITVNAGGQITATDVA